LASADRGIMLPARFSSYSSSEGRIIGAFFAYAQATAFEPWPSAACA
jgi:hypothetical protein